MFFLFCFFPVFGSSSSSSSSSSSRSPLSVLAQQPWSPPMSVVEGLGAVLASVAAQLDVHTVIEIALAVVIGVLLMQKAYPNEVKRDRLSAAEVDELIRDWKPEPLVPGAAVGVASSAQCKENVLTSAPGARVVLNGRSVVNFTASNPLGLSGRADTIQTAEEAIKK